MIPVISNLPPAPKSDDEEEVFESKSYVFVAAQDRFVAEANALAGAVNQLAGAVAADAEAAARDSDAAMGFRNEARAARDVARDHADAAGRDRVDSDVARFAAESAAGEANDSAKRAEAAAADAGVAVASAVKQTSAVGAAVLPTGTTSFPDVIPGEGLLLRGIDGKPHWYDRGSATWKRFGAESGDLLEVRWHNGPRSSIPRLQPGSIPMSGQKITLLQYPEAVQAVLDGLQNSVPAAEWEANPSKRNCWGIGNGWVCVPDLNGDLPDTGKPFYLRGGPEALSGTSVGDAIRNITGNTGATLGNWAVSGAFKTGGDFGVNATGGTTFAYIERLFDSSRVVPTADENRVKTAYGCMTVRVFSEVSNAGSVDAATLATQLAVVDAKVQSLDAATGFTVIYPNGGTAAAPANVAINSRYVLANPFPGYQVLCIAEVQVGGVWGESGWAYSSTTAGGYGTRASQSSTEGIVVCTGTIAVAATGQDSGGSFTLASPITTPLPCRVKVWKLKGGA